MDASKKLSIHRKTHPPMTPKGVNTPLNHTFPRASTTQMNENNNIFQTPLSKAKTNSSPIPIPDQTVFDSRITLSAASSDKKKSATTSKSNGKYQPPSPPSKSPPISRLFSRTPLYTPNAQPIIVEGNSNALTNRENYFETMFENHTSIGRGSFAEVYSVSTKESKEKYAIKKKKKPFRGMQDRERAIRELSTGITLSKNQHPHIVHYILGWEEKGYLYIQTELCERTLQDYLNDTEIIEEDKIWEFILDISLGLHHIHKNELVHLDIKPGNILLSFNGILKIGDFGLTIKPDLWRRDEDSEGDSRYMAPELFKDDDSVVDPMQLKSQMIEEDLLKSTNSTINTLNTFNAINTSSSILGSERIGYEADVFSLGATIFELASNITDMPKSGDSWQYLRSGNLSLQAIPNAPKRSYELEELINKMMHPDPKKRITILDILHFPRLKNLLQNRVNSGVYGSFNIMDYVYGMTRRSRSRSNVNVNAVIVDKNSTTKQQHQQPNSISKSLSSTGGSSVRRALVSTKSDPELKCKNTNESKVSYTIPSAIGSNFDTSMGGGRRNLFGMEVDQVSNIENKVSHATKRPAMQMEIDTDVTMADAESTKGPSPRNSSIPGSSSSSSSSEDRPLQSPDIAQDQSPSTFTNSPTQCYNTRAGIRKILHRKSKSGDVRVDRESGRECNIIINNTHHVRPNTGTVGGNKRRESARLKSHQVAEIFMSSNSSLQAIPNDFPSSVIIQGAALPVTLATDTPSPSNAFVPRKIDFNDAL